MEKKKFYQTMWFTILLLVFFAPVGIFFLWKNGFWNKTARLIVSGVAAVFFIFAVIDGMPTKAEKVAEAERQVQLDKEKFEKKEAKAAEKEKKEQEKKDNEDKKKAELEEKEEKAKQKESEKKEEEKAKEQEEVKAKKKEEEEKKANRTIEEIIIEKGIADDIDLYEGELTISHEPSSMWSENSLMSVVHDMLENLPIAFEDDEIDSVVNIIKVEMIDNKGNEETKQVISYRYTREDYKSLNYEKFKEMSLGEEWRILNEADGYFIHPGIRAKLKDKYTDNLY